MKQMVIGRRYNWKGQPERLIYIGRNWSGNGYWHQFELEDKPGVVWCEVTDTDLSRLGETQPDIVKINSELVYELHSIARNNWNNSSGATITECFAIEICNEICKLLHAEDRHRAGYFAGKIKQHFGIE